MAIINTLADSSNDILYPITSDTLLYHNDAKVSSLIGNKSVTSITGDINVADSDIIDFQSELNKIEELKTLVSATDSDPDSLISAINISISEISNTAKIIENDTIVTTNFVLHTIDVTNMSDSDRTELGTLLGMEITTSTKLYASYLGD